MSTGQRERVESVLFRGELVKICGLREPEHAVVATEAGADFISFIFAPSRRQVAASTARACIDAARGVARSTPVLAVGVFVDEDPAGLLRTAEEAGLDLVQLSGKEPTSYVESLSIPAIKGFQPRPGEEAGAIVSTLRAYLASRNGAIAALIDGYHPTAKGGTGLRADWNLAAEVCAEQSFMLAGGLEPENVAEAIATVCPLGVDVSGGVERDGVKDSRLIIEFVHRAKAAYVKQRLVLQEAQDDGNLNHSES